MPEASLSSYTRRENRSAILSFEGCLDVATAPKAIEAIQQFIREHGPDLVLETSRLDFIDSKGVGALLAGAKAAYEAGGRIFLHHPSLPVRKILEMCGLLAMFPPRQDCEPLITEPALDPDRPAPPRPRTTSATAKPGADGSARPLRKAA